ncbi:MAG: branched-chain amino acid ABC transporter permease [Pseudomonadota bacterium]
MRRLIFHPCGNFRETYEEEFALFETDFGRVWVIVGLALLFGVVPLVSGAYVLYILNHIAIAAIAAVGLNLLIGYTGLISLGHGAFFGVGAYTAAILVARLGFPFWLAVLSAGVVTAMVGMVFGIPSARLKHLYLTIATLAGQFIIQYLFVHWDQLTGGAEGIVLPGTTFLGMNVRNDLTFFFIVCSCLVVSIWVAVNIVRTRFGRAFVAIRDNDRAAEGMGIPVFRYKLLSFAISSFYAGFAGGLWALYVGSITPEPFTMSLSIDYIAMVIIGGLGSIAGSVFGAVFITLLNEGLSTLTTIVMNMEGFKEWALTIAPLREFVFGGAIVAFIILEPRGLAEVWRIVRSSFRLWPFSY